MASKTLVRSAFRRFVELVEPIDDVLHVVATDEACHDVFTYIRRRDEDVSRQIFAAEGVLRNEFPGVAFDFHVTFLEGNELQDFVGRLPRLTFSKDIKIASARRNEHDSAQDWVQCCAMTAEGVRCRRAVPNPPYPVGQYQGWHALCWQHREEIRKMLVAQERREKAASRIEPAPRRYRRIKGA